MKRVNRIYLMGVIACLATSCYKMEPTNNLSRGNSVFYSWIRVTKNIIDKQHACKGMNQLLDAESDEERLAISAQYFPNAYITELGANQYGVFKGTSSQLELLFSTNGLPLDSLGAKWNIMFNIDKDYDAHSSSWKGKLTKGLPPWTVTTTSTLEGVYPKNCMLHIECVGDRTWTIKSNPVQTYFDVDFTLKDVPITVFGTTSEMETYLGGTGAYNFYEEQEKTVHAHLDFAITTDLVFINHITMSNIGSIDMVVSKPDGTSSFDVGVEYIGHNSYELSYGGAMKQFSGYYY